MGGTTPEAAEQSGFGFGRTVGALSRGVRPRQWPKNLLVFAAPATAGTLSDASQVGKVVTVFLGLCAVSSALYLFNDIRDADADRLHPVKRHRPIASGALDVRTAIAAAVVLMVVGLVLVASVGLLALALVALYAVTALSYTLALKRVPVVELFVVAAGFVIRAGVGAAAVSVPVSVWFLAVASFGALGVVVGKRTCERRRSDIDPSATRSVLARYPDAFLVRLQRVSMRVSVPSKSKTATVRGPLIGPLRRDARGVAAGCVRAAGHRRVQRSLVSQGTAVAAGRAAIHHRVLPPPRPACPPRWRRRSSRGACRGSRGRSSRAASSNAAADRW